MATRATAKIKSTKEDTAKAVEVAVKLAGPDTIGGKIDAMFKLREKKRELQKQIDAIEAEFGAINESLIEALKGQGLDASRGKLASASISEVIVPVVKDWDRAIAYIEKNHYWHMFERRISSTAFREVYEKLGDKKVLKETGMEPFKKINVNLKTL